LSEPAWRLIATQDFRKKSFFQQSLCLNYVAACFSLVWQHHRASGEDHILNNWARNATLNMVLTDRQRAELHAGIHEYLLSQQGDLFARAAEAMAMADPQSCQQKASGDAAPKASSVPIIEKKWTAVPRLQKKVLELERALSQSARSNLNGGVVSGMPIKDRRMIPRPPCVHTLQSHNGVVTCVAVHPVFTMAVSGGEDATIKVWDHESGEYVRTLRGHTQGVNSVCFTPKTGSHICSSSSDLSIKLWDFATHVCIRTLKGHDHTISDALFIPNLQGSAIKGGGENDFTDCSQLVSASRDYTIKFWDLETGFCVHTSKDHTDWVRCLATKADGSLLASSGSDQAIVVRKTDGDRKKICELRGHEHVVESLAFMTMAAGAQNSNMGATQQKRILEMADYLVSGSRDRSVRMWNAMSGELLKVFKFHENWVRSVILHPSGNFIFSAGDDRSIRVIDLKSDRNLRTIDNAHPHFVSSIAMHPTLPILVSGSIDHSVKCWLLD